MSAEKPRKDKVKADAEDLPNYQSQSRVNLPNTPSGHSAKVRQTDKDKPID